MQCQLFLSHLFHLIFRGTRCRKIMGRYLISFFLQVGGGDRDVCVCVLRGVVSWSDLVVMVDLVRSALRNFGQCGSERPNGCASLWHALLNGDSFNRNCWHQLHNLFTGMGASLNPPCFAIICASLLLTRPCWRENPNTPRCFWSNLVRLCNPHLCLVTTSSDNLQCDRKYVLYVTVTISHS